MIPCCLFLVGVLAVAPNGQTQPHHAKIEALLQEPPSYTGEPIDLDLVDTPLAEALRILAEIGDFSYVLDPGVAGTVTLHLKGVPWDQALGLILKSHGLGVDVENGTLLVGDP